MRLGFKILLVLLVGALGAAWLTAEAADITIQWQQPLEWEDGDPLQLESLDRYEFGCSFDSQDYTLYSRTWIASATMEKTETFTLPGTYYCALRVKPLDELGDFSLWSNEVSFLIRSRPNPPTDLIVIVEGG